jgi:hypothetical protein
MKLVPWLQMLKIHIPQTLLMQSICASKPSRAPVSSLYLQTSANLLFLCLPHQGIAVAWAGCLHLNLAANKQMCLTTNALRMTGVQLQKNCEHCWVESSFVKYADGSWPFVAAVVRHENDSAPLHLHRFLIHECQNAHGMLDADCFLLR